MYQIRFSIIWQIVFIPFILFFGFDILRFFLDRPSSSASSEPSFFILFLLVIFAFILSLKRKVHVSISPEKLIIRESPIAKASEINISEIDEILWKIPKTGLHAGLKILKVNLLDGTELKFPSLHSVHFKKRENLSNFMKQLGIKVKYS